MLCKEKTEFHFTLKTKIYFLANINETPVPTGQHQISSATTPTSEAITPSFPLLQDLPRRQLASKSRRDEVDGTVLGGRGGGGCGHPGGPEGERLARTPTGRHAQDPAETGSDVFGDRQA